MHRNIFAHPSETLRSLGSIPVCVAFARPHHEFAISIANSSSDVLSDDKNISTHLINHKICPAVNNSIPPKCFSDTESACSHKTFLFAGRTSEASIFDGMKNAAEAERKPLNPVLMILRLEGFWRQS